METEEFNRLISESKSFLEDYRMFGKAVSDAIEALSRVQDLVSEPTKVNLNEALNIVNGLSDQLSPFRGYVPTLAEDLDKIQRWLREKAI